MISDQDTEKETTLQLVRQSIRSRSLGRLKQAFERPWAVKVLMKFAEASPSPEYRIFNAALKTMRKEERQRAFQWTWDCYHPYMSDLGKCLEDMDGYVQKRHL
jgi:hypothetical protein